MDLPSQAGEAGGWEIMAGGLLSGRLKAPWWAKGLILNRELLVRTGEWEVSNLLFRRSVRGVRYVRLVVELVRLPELVRVGHRSVGVVGRQWSREQRLLVHRAGGHYLGGAHLLHLLYRLLLLLGVKI